MLIGESLGQLCALCDVTKGNKASLPGLGYGDHACVCGLHVVDVRHRSWMMGFKPKVKYDDGDPGIEYKQAVWFLVIVNCFDCRLEDLEWT